MFVSSTFLRFSCKEVDHFRADALFATPFPLRLRFFTRGKPIISRITLCIFCIHFSSKSRSFILLLLAFLVESRNLRYAIKASLFLAFRWEESIISSLVLLLSWWSIASVFGWLVWALLAHIMIFYVSFLIPKMLFWLYTTFICLH